MSKKPFDLSSLLVVLGLVFIAATGFRTISTPEIWTHLAQGRTNEPLSYLASDSVVNTTHLYDKLAYFAWNAGGAPLLILLNIAGLIISFVLLLQISKKWGGPISQGFALLIAGHLMFQTLDVGPQVIMMLFISLFLYVLTTQKKLPILFGILIPLQILWTNMHSSFLYGPLLAGLTVGQTMLQNKGSGRKNRTQTIPPAHYGMLSGALLAATLVNPYLFKLHAQVYANIANPDPSYWSSLFNGYFLIPPFKPLLLFVMILGAGGLITLKKKLPLVLTTVAIYSAFLSYNSPQLSLLFTVFTFPFIVLSLTAISEYIHGSLENILGSQARLLMPATSGVLVLLFVLSLIPVVSNCAYVKTGSASCFGLGIEDQLYPNGAAAQIINDPAFPAPEKTINMAADGGYIAFNYDRKIFIDYRPGRYEDAVLGDLAALLSGDREAYNRITDTYRPEAFIINTLSPASAQGIVTLLSRGLWKLAYFDGTTAILLQNNQDEFSSIFENTEAQQAGLRQLEAARAAYADNADSCSAGNPAELIGSGKIYLAFNRPVQAKAIFSLLLQNNRRIPEAWVGLGSSQMQLKEFDAANASLKTATELNPSSGQAWWRYANVCQLQANQEKDPARRAELEAEAKEALEKMKQISERNRKKDEPKDEMEVIPKDAPRDQSLEEKIL